MRRNGGASVGYTMDTIRFEWLPSPVEFDPTLELPQYHLINYTLANCSQVYTTGLLLNSPPLRDSIIDGYNNAIYT